MTFEIQVEDLHRAYRNWAGEPFSISTFRRENLPPTRLAALDLLCYRSTDEDRLRPENEFTFFATAGLSLQEAHRPLERFELIWRIAGRRSCDEIQALAEALATLAALPMYGPVVFAPGAIIRNVSLPVFDRMDSLLVTHWGVHTPEYLPGLRPPVLLLGIKALFGSEAMIVEHIDHREACRRFILEGVDCDDPARSCASLRGEDD
jgi:hypothetical protein